MTDLLVDCEGSNQPPAGVYFAAAPVLIHAICAMCGQVVGCLSGATVSHQRRDVLAMLARGDLDGAERLP